jgi:hypothetical protein
VDCIRLKLSEMGILNPKGNLYSKVPLHPVKSSAAASGASGRNPMSPLPEPPTSAPATAPASTAATPATPVAAAAAETEVLAVADNGQCVSGQPRARTSIVDVSDQVHFAPIYDR